MSVSRPPGGRRLAPAGGARVTSPAPMLLAWRLAIIGALVVLAGVAWWMTDLRMAGMDAGPGTDPGALGFYVTTWVVMMAAMMFPSVAPMVLMCVGLQRGRRERGMAAPGGARGPQARTRPRRRAARMEPRRPLGGGRRAAGSGGVRVHAAEGGVPDALPWSARVPGLAMAGRARRRAADGARARGMVHRVLLGPDGRSVRPRRHEPGLDDPHRRPDRGGEDAAVARRRDRGRRRCPARAGHRAGRGPGAGPGPDHPGASGRHGHERHGPRESHEPEGHARRPQTRHDDVARPARRHVPLTPDCATGRACLP